MWAPSGRPYPHVSVRVVDPDTLLPLEGEATGELWVRGPSVFAGYLGDDAATARAMAGDWLRTGDLVHRDADGVFRVVDRIKDVYISGGENVAPAEVEYALGLHPLVEASAVVGVPDPVWGERGVAFVVPVAGAAAVGRRGARACAPQSRGVQGSRARGVRRFAAALDDREARTVPPPGSCAAD